MCDCDYCFDKENVLEDYESKDGTIRNLAIIFLPLLGHIRVKIIDNEGIKWSFGIDKRINFCPMCGTKL